MLIWWYTTCIVCSVKFQPAVKFTWLWHCRIGIVEKGGSQGIWQSTVYKREKHILKRSVRLEQYWCSLQTTFCTCCHNPPCGQRPAKKIQVPFSHTYWMSLSLSLSNIVVMFQFCCCHKWTLANGSWASHSHVSLKDGKGCFYCSPATQNPFPPLGDNESTISNKPSLKHQAPLRWKCPLGVKRWKTG